MGYQDHEKVDCSICNSTGVTLKGREPRPCFCGEQVDAEELERRFLAERGIKAKPGIKAHHLLAGEPSDEEKALQAVLKAHEGQVARTAEPEVQVDEKVDCAVCNAMGTTCSVCGESVDAEELERQLLAEHGIKAKPGIEEKHLLPHEGGELSKEQKELQAILKAGEELKDRYGPELYRFYRAGQFSESEADEIAEALSRAVEGVSYEA